MLRHRHTKLTSILRSVEGNICDHLIRDPGHEVLAVIDTPSQGAPPARRSPRSRATFSPCPIMNATRLRYTTPQAPRGHANKPHHRPQPGNERRPPEFRGLLAPRLGYDLQRHSVGRYAPCREPAALLPRRTDGQTEAPSGAATSVRSGKDKRRFGSSRRTLRRTQPLMP